MNANDYVAAGYSALGGILVLYVVHLRHRARVLAAALAPPRTRPRAGGAVASGGAPDSAGERA